MDDPGSEIFEPARAFDRLKEFVSFAPSPPGTAAHERVVEWLADTLHALGLEAVTRRFEVVCSRSRSPRGEAAGRATLTNVLVRVPGVARDPAPVLLGTHFDTRWIADRERSAARRDTPIPGANDGGSGTACLLELARGFVDLPPPRDVVLAFFDGEDLGNIDGHWFCIGSRAFVQQRDPAFWPAAAVVLDMVGGAGARYCTDQEGNAYSRRSRSLFGELFRLGRALGYEPFSGGSCIPVYSDQAPLIDGGIPAAVLIDLDYPQWHTLDDTIAHCSADSLAAAGVTTERWVRGLGTARAPRPGEKGKDR